MERVIFLIESTGDRLGCLLNPESVTVNRLAGIRPRQSVSGPVSGARLSDDPLLYTGGGLTELKLDLLFDTSVAGSTIPSDDIRDLTRPLRDLAENGAPVHGSRQGGPPVATFIWGKAWNIPGVVTNIAEKLESFTPDGIPRRSWIRLKFLRVGPRVGRQPRAERTLTPLSQFLSSSSGPQESARPAFQPDRLMTHEVVGSSDPIAGGGERLDEVATRYYGNASLWRLIAAASGIDDPRRIAAGTLLKIPVLSSLNRRR